MYGKLVNGKIEYAPEYIRKDNQDIFNYNIESNSIMLIADGYKKVVDSLAPSEMREPRKVWTEIDTEITATWVDDYIPPLPPTDAEISSTRAALYASSSDHVFAAYQQGVASLQDYIDAKAQISFDNKKSTQTGMTLDDFKHKVSREYELFKQSGKVIKNTTYDYKESSGTDDLIVSDADISLIRPTTGVKVILPAITKTQIVKIDNVSGDAVNISSVNNEFIDGVGSPYTLQSKGVIEFIADVSKKSWDTYTAPLEIEDGINIEVEVNLHADKINEPVYFYLTKNGREIQGSRVEFTPTVAHEPQAVIPTMKAKVLNGDVVGLGFETSSENGAYLETESAQYPMTVLTIRTSGAI